MRRLFSTDRLEVLEYEDLEGMTFAIEKEKGESAEATLSREDLVSLMIILVARLGEDYQGWRDGG